MDYLIRQDIETVIELQDISTDEFSKNLGVSRVNDEDTIAKGVVILRNIRKRYANTQ